MIIAAVLFIENWGLSLKEAPVALFPKISVSLDVGSKVETRFVYPFKYWQI